MANDQGTLLAYRNWIEDPATTFETETEEVGDRVVENIATSRSDDFWRIEVAEGSTSAVVTATFSQDREVGVVTTQFPRGTYPGVSESSPVFASTDTIRYRLLDASNVELWDSGTDQSGVVVGYMTHYAKLDTAVNARKLEVTYNALSRASATFFDVGMLGAWSVIEPSVGFAYPGGFGWRHNTENQRTSAGALYTARFEPMRRWSLAFDFLTNAESLIIDEMIRYSGGARQVFIRRGDLPVGKDAMLALVTAGRDMEARTAELRQQSLSFEEFI